MPFHSPRTLCCTVLHIIDADGLTRRNSLPLSLSFLLSVESTAADASIAYLSPLSLSLRAAAAAVHL